MWKWCQVQPSQKERAMDAVHCKNEGMLLPLLGWRCIDSVVFVWPIHENDQRWTYRLLGFECCDISTYWWIWMLSTLLKHIWIGIDYFLLNFFATFGSILGLEIAVTFGSVLGLQVTVGLQVNTGLQPPIRWEPFVADTMLRRPEPTQERVEPTMLSIIATEITHLIRFALLLLLRILRYMWRNHVVTWA